MLSISNKCIGLLYSSLLLQLVLVDIFNALRSSELPSLLVVREDGAPKAVIVVESFEQTNKMGHCGEDDEDVEELMRSSPDIKTSWIPLLWYSSLHHR